MRHTPKTTEHSASKEAGVPDQIIDTVVARVLHADAFRSLSASFRSWHRPPRP
jgi:hypothetical protein